MLALIAIWALAEAILFFIVADVPIMALGIKAGWRKALVGALVGAIFAAIGGTTLAYAASQSPLQIIDLMLSVPAVDQALIEQVWDDWQDNGAIGMLLGSVSGVPYKLYAATAGMQILFGEVASSLTLFFFASITARLPRFALVALVAGWLGPRLVKRFGARLVWSGFVLGWVGFYALYWSLMGF
ncbi:MAG: hypothetical protein AAF697_03715 [Pseudomonadota bacterium]